MNYLSQLIKIILHWSVAIGVVASLFYMAVQAASPVSQNTNQSDPSDLSLALDPVIEGLLSSFAVPLEDLFKKKYDSEWENLFSGFSGNFALDFPLQRTQPQPEEGQGTQGEPASHSLTAHASLKYNPLGYWFANIDIIHYFNKSLQAPWNGDFTYSFGYNDPKPYTLSLVYSNYGGNRFHPDRSKGEQTTHFLEGTYSLGWKLPIPKAIAEPFLIDTNQTINCNLNYNLTPRYLDITTSQKLKNKRSWVFGCNYPIISGFSMNFALFAYPNRSQRQPWDPDYTYGFNLPNLNLGLLSLQYSNYSGNSFTSGLPGLSSLKNGSLGLSWSWAW